MVRCVVPVGKRENALTHPAGLILLAGLSMTTLSETLIPFTDTLINELVDIRHQHTSVKNQGDIVTMAAPICPDGHHPEAALMLCCPTISLVRATRAET